MKIFRKLFDFMETTLSAIAMCAMTALCFINVVCRYGFSASISFTEEITIALFVFVCVIGTSLCAKERGHLGMSILTDLMPEKWRYFTSGIGNVVAAIFGALIVFLGTKMVINQIKVGMISIALAIPEWIYEIWLPIGACFYTIRFFECALEDFKAFNNCKKGKEA